MIVLNNTFVNRHVYYKMFNNVIKKYDRFHSVWDKVVDEIRNFEIFMYYKFMRLKIMINLI